ncbi:hypothetical protein C0J52_24710 [Blattella germanica]|nr:hypothetical protein C0J52_24710 [Blattella germanica]
MKKNSSSSDGCRRCNPLWLKTKHHDLSQKLPRRNAADFVTSDSDSQLRCFAFYIIQSSFNRVKIVAETFLFRLLDTTMNKCCCLFVTFGLPESALLELDPVSLKRFKVYRTPDSDIFSLAAICL